MNQGLFKLIFNRRTGLLTPTWEGASACGKASSTARACVLTLTLLFFSHSVLANPTGATVVNGNVSFASNGNTLSITNSPNAIINWQSFSINKGEITKFIQEHGASAVLNRITGQDPSTILGTLQSKIVVNGMEQTGGRMILINPNGFTFGAGSVIDVGGLIVSTLKLSNEDFLAGKYKFSDGVGAGSIKNEGTINTTSGGQVYLIAPNIENSGIITSPEGEIVLAAGHSVSLVDPKNPEIVVSITAPATQAVNVGQLIAQGGSIGIYAGLVNQAGIVNANSASVDESGRIYLKGTQSTTLGAYSVTSASNSAGNGGEITITSGENTTIAAGARIAADAGQNGNGGKVTIWSDGSTQFDGKISAQGGAQSGNGGFVETSAQHVTIGDTARVTTRAANGKNGTWLIDPSDFTIAATGGDISGATLSANLGNNNVTIESSNGFNVMGNGDIHVNDAVSWSANNLTLTAARDININDVLTVSGTASLTLNTATANGQDAAVAGGTVRVGFNPDGSFKGRVDFSSTGKGLVDFISTSPLTINGNVYTIINSLGAEGSTTGTDLQGINGNFGFYALGANIDASATSSFMGGFNPIVDVEGGFSGIFEGLGHTINNLTINRPAQNNVGLFGELNGGEIRNVGLVSANVIGLGSVGALVGSNFNGLVTNSYATGTVGNGSGSMYVGGLVGFSNGTITNSYATSAVTGGDGANSVGGLVGFNAGTISTTYASGAVRAGLGAYNIGGLVGLNDSGAYGGGIISNSYATGSVFGAANANTLGGFAGLNFGTISTSYATGFVSAGPGAFSLGGFTGSSGEGTSINNFWNIETSGLDRSAEGIGLTTAQMKQASNFTGFDFATVWDIVEGLSLPYQRALFPNGILLPVIPMPMPMPPPLDPGLIAPHRIGPFGGTSSNDFNVVLLSNPPAAVSDELYMDLFITGEDRDARLLCQ